MPKLGMEPIRRDQIRRAAASIISKRGFESATIQEIAKKAGISTGTVNHYYANKAAVELDAFLYVSEWFQNSMRGALKPEDSAEGQLRTLVEIGVFDDRPQAHIGFRVWVWALSESFRSKEMARLVSERRKEFQKLLASVLIKFKKHADLSPEDLAELAAECDAYMNGLCIHRITGELKLDSDAVYRSLRAMAEARFS